MDAQTRTFSDVCVCNTTIRKAQREDGEKTWNDVYQ